MGRQTPREIGSTRTEITDIEFQGESDINALSKVCPHYVSVGSQRFFKHQRATKHYRVSAKGGAVSWRDKQYTIWSHLESKHLQKVTISFVTL